MSANKKVKPKRYPEQIIIGVLCIFWVAAYIFCWMAPLGQNKNPDAPFGPFDAFSLVIFVSPLPVLAGIVAALVHRVNYMVVVAICGVIPTILCLISGGGGGLSDCDTQGETCSPVSPTSTTTFFLAVIVFLVWVLLPFILSRTIKARALSRS